MHAHPMPIWGSYILYAAVIGLLFLRMRGMSRERQLRLEQLWIVPAIYALLLAFVLYEFPPRGLMWMWLALACAAGAALGWRRGAFMRITIDPETHQLNQQASPAALVFIIGLILLRKLSGYEATRMGIDIMSVTDVLMVSALGLIAATRAEMYLRAKRLLAGARG